jgi:hypothetical protein
LAHAFFLGVPRQACNRTCGAIRGMRVHTETEALEMLRALGDLAGPGHGG